MKRTMFLSLMAVFLMAAITVGFLACSSDEVEDTNPSKAELLRAKAKEFAKKYGVQMTLNEENIAQIAETLTVEQMEKDFQTVASFKGATFVSQEIPMPRTKGLKIQRTKQTKEEEAFDRDKEYSGTSSDKSEQGITSVQAQCSWYYRQTGESGVRVTGAFYDNGAEVAHATDVPNAHFATSSGRVTFRVEGRLSFSYKKYTLVAGYVATEDRLKLTFPL